MVVAKRSRTPRKSLAMRQMAVVVALFAMLTGTSRTALWESIPDVEGWYAEKATLKMRPDKFIKFWHDRFWEEGSLLDHKIQRKTSASIPEDEAKLASWYLKLGYWEEVPSKRGGEPRHVHRYYSSVAKACRKDPQLRAIRDTYGLTNKQLLHEIKKVDPALRRRRCYVKYGFTPDQMIHRQTRAKSLLQRATLDPTFLDRCYFIDECTIWLDNTLLSGQQVWADAHDQGVHHVIHYPRLSGSKRIKVHIIAAVNAVHGTVYLEFTTGTSDIQRLQNKKPEDPQHGPYKVSLTDCYNLQITMLFCAAVQTLNPGSIIASSSAYVSHLPLLYHPTVL